MARFKRSGICRALAAIGLALLSGCAKSTPATAPVGDTTGQDLLAFVSDRNQAAGQYDIYLYDMDAGGFHLLRGINSPTAVEHHPAISPDGLVVAFASDRFGTGNTDILLYSRELQQLVTQPNLNSALNESEPCFTGDAVKLAFTQQTANGATRVRLYDGLGDTLIKLPGLDTTATYSDWAPSPDAHGHRIAFVSNRSGNPDIFVWDSAGDTLLDLPGLNSSASDVDPCLTWDSRFLCFASDRAGGAGGYDLYLYDLLARGFVASLPAAIQSPQDERHPALGQSAAVIVFQSNRAGGKGGWDLWNWQLSSNSVGQAPEESGGGDDIEPCLLYP